MEQRSSKRKREDNDDVASCSKRMTGEGDGLNFDVLFEILKLFVLTNICSTICSNLILKQIVKKQITKIP